MEVSQALLGIVLFAMIGEAVIEALAPGLDWVFDLLPLPEGLNPYFYLSLILGLVLAFSYQLDLIRAMGLWSDTTWIGMAMTGIVVSRGSNSVHSLAMGLYRWSQQYKDGEPSA